jgi:pimeloyl-ACP methyl ester carboxylesterase
MARRRRHGRKLIRSLLPIALVLLLVVVGALGWIVYGVTHPPRQAYLVTPQAFQQISGPVLKATDETWTNRDGTKARGWLLRGAEGAPAVVFLHRYGADRSWVFNLGVKVHEATNFTILWPDLRGHGLDPPVRWTSFGGRESDDVLSALDYLGTLKGERGQALVGDRVGLYGVELGAYAAARAALHDTRVRVLVLDSVPGAPDELLYAAVKGNLGMDNRLIQYLTRVATRIYFLGRYDNTPACQLAAALPGQRVLLLSGEDAGYLKNSTTALARCFPNQANVEVKTGLPLTGFQQPSATGEQGEGYDRRVIEFFDKNLRP